MTEHVWQAEIDELAYRKSLAAEMGGAERVGRQHEFGKLTIRERFDAFADPGSFEEVGGPLVWPIMTTTASSSRSLRPTSWSGWPTSMVGLSFSPVMTSRCGADPRS